MGFFYNDNKADEPVEKKPAKRRGPIPIASLAKLGCSACPRDQDEKELRTPKMPAEGSDRPLIYILGGSPSADDDEEGGPFLDKAGSAIYKKFGKGFMAESGRMGYLRQCAGDADTAATECCRPRIVADIERTKPLVIVGVGDEPLRWATELPAQKASALNHRGTLFAVKIGEHQCWFFSILYPNFVFKESYKKSEYEITLEHDVEFIKDFVSQRDLFPPKVYEPPFDQGVEIITGHEPGDMQRLEKALDEIARLLESTIDLETNGLRVMMKKNPMILTCAVGVFERVVAFPVHHPEGWGTQAQIKRVEGLLMRFLLDSGEKAAHNLAMEMEWLDHFFPGVLRRTQWADTMALAHTLDERKNTKSLEVQSCIRFGFNVKAQSSIDASRLLEYPLVKVLRYNGIDVKWTDLLRRTLKPVVWANPAYRGEYERKVRTAPTLVLMERLGLPVDMRFAEKMQVTLEDAAMKIDGKARRCPEVQDYQKRYGPFSITNSDHVLKLMKELLKREEVEVRGKGKDKERILGYTTDEDHLALIPADEVPSAPLILEHRGIEKMLSTYIRPVTTKAIIGTDGLIHSKYGSMEAETGRLTSEDPNVQNWPNRKPFQREARGMIAAPDGEWMVACDYGQIEFRVVGMCSEDSHLVKACWTGYDVHMYWAERMVDKYPRVKDRIVRDLKIDWDEKGMKALRQDSKNMWVFPMFFGSMVRSCADNLQIPLPIMEELAEEFWDDFRGVKKWQEELLLSYEKHGYVETLDGRRRRGPLSPNQIINHPIQGTALSIVCEAMNVLSEKAEIEERWDRHPRFNGHDDLSFFMPDATLEENIQIIGREMVKPRFPWINVPLLVEVSVGSRWNKKEEIAKFWSHEVYKTPNPYEETRA